NLCINARDAMNGVGIIELVLDRHSIKRRKCHSCHKNISGEFVLLSVSDNGPGIDPVILERMFEPFASTKEVGKGSGMGLAMVHGIMHEVGGHVIVESSEHTGTTISLLFPIDEPQNDIIEWQDSA
ncbi:MAG: ATP-binding protein, partial [Gammaproteobacteria bacterium]|nr:ATP-binding protein [Gammaproteobacteria bacterium]